MIDRTLNYGRPVIRRFLQQIPPYSSVLDIGAGTGVDLQIAQDIAPLAALHAVECHPPAVANLRTRGWNVHSINIENQAFPLPAESLDVVMANQVLEHVKEIFWILDQTAKSLKVGGHLIVGLPNLASLHNRLLLLLGRQPTAITIHSAHVRGYTQQGFLTFLNKVAPGLFEVEAFSGANFYPFPPILARPLAAVLPNMAWGIFLLLKKKKAYLEEFLLYAAPGKLETNYFIGSSTSA